MRTRRILPGMAVILAATLAPAIASAQWNNQPYQFRNNAGSGAGMSMAYRQAIINEELYGRRPENLVKSPDGRLLEVIERDQQAFLAEPEPNFIVPRSGYAAGAAGLYFSAGGAGASIGGWTAMLAQPGTISTYAGARPSSSPIDAWVGMLD